MKDYKIVTFGVIAYNEQKYLPALLLDLVNQTYPKRLIEVVLVDAISTDNTRQIMEDFRNKYQRDYKSIIILKNRKKIQPAGWNLVIKNCTGDILLRIDAHARLPENFIEKNIECINSGESVCGGPRENIIDEDKPWKRMLLTAEMSMFGAGIATYRQETAEKKYVKSVFHGAYRHNVLDEVGLFNEDLVRTEDNEYHYRIIKAGYKICYDPQIQSRYQTRSNLKGMIRQKYQNGLWVGKTLLICPGCISIFHLIPFAFVCAIIVTAIMCLFGVSWPIIALWIAYAVANVGMTLAAIVSSKEINVCLLVLPVVFLLLHVGYGFGTVKGISEKIVLRK